MIPECNITLENVWRYIALYPDGSIHYEEAGFMLGSYDDRTIRKHILSGYRMIEKANLILTEFLSTFPGYAQVPELKAGESAYGYLSLLVEEANPEICFIRRKNKSCLREICFPCDCLHLRCCKPFRIRKNAQGLPQKGCLVNASKYTTLYFFINITLLTITLSHMVVKYFIFKTNNNLMGVSPLMRLPQHIVFGLFWLSSSYVQNHLLVG